MLKAEEQFNKHTKLHNFQHGQLVLRQECFFQHKNAKLAPKFSRPHRITHLKDLKTVKLKLKFGKRRVVSTNQIIPYKDPFTIFMPTKQDLEEHLQNSLLKLSKYPEFPNCGFKKSGKQENAVPTPGQQPNQISSWLPSNNKTDFQTQTN